MDNLISKTDRIFVCGHRGMVGQSICKSLKRSGYSNILSVERSVLDLRDFGKVKAWFRENKPDVVVLAAAKVGGIDANLKNPTEFLLDNIKIQNNIIETSWKNNIKRLLFLGSSCIYPKYTTQPIKEEQLLDDYLEDTNKSYALAKIVGIQLCNSIRTQYGFDAISLMPTNLYGFGDNYDNSSSHVVAAMIRRFHEAILNKENTVTFWGTGKPYREFLNVDDLAYAIIYALEKWDPMADNAPLDAYGKPLTYLNVGTGKDISIFDLAYKISEIFKFKGEILWDNSKPDGTPRKLLDISKITKIGWQPKINLNEGLSDTIHEYQRNFKKINFKSEIN